MTGGVGAAVLAAGGAARFRASRGGGADDPADHKLLAPFRGRPLVAWALEAAAGAALERTFVVTGAVELEGLVPPGAEVLANPDWASGQASSLQVALRAAREAGLGALVVGLGDQPLVPAAAWSAVARGRGPIVVATYAGRRRNPVRLDESVWSELPTVGDEGARRLIGLHPELVSEVACDGDPADVDTWEDLRRWS
ncbi:MAG: NTP transferase domain-containing protein [Actinomycetota bacterium]|nr:NTP transferase domain-containing protein [Actinomycetota bacterium]